MAIAAAEYITNLLNGTISVINTVIPMEFEMGKPQSEVDLETKDDEQIGVTKRNQWFASFPGV